MRIPSSHLFHFFNALSLFTLRNLTKAQILSDNIFENASNNTWVLKKEYANNAFCEYDSCHLVLEPNAKQWIAFSTSDGNDTLIYDICDITQPAISYKSGEPECMAYSGATITVTSIINNITALGNEYVQSTQVNKIMENQTDSEACLEVYNIQATLLDNPSQSSTKKNNGLTTNQLIITMFLFTLSACCLLLFLSKNKFAGKKKELLLINEEKFLQKEISETSIGIFSHPAADTRKKTTTQQSGVKMSSLV